MKKLITSISLATIILALIIVPLTAQAGNNWSQENIYIAENELVPYNFVALAGKIDFQGEAQKDVVVAGGDVKINGPVHGDVIVVGGTVVINGNIDGNVRVLGGTVEINGKVGKNITGAGANITLGSNSDVGWDVMIGGDILDLKGKIAGNVNVAARTLILGGKIGGNIEAYVSEKGQLNVLPNTNVGGKLSYWATTESAIPDSAIINGEIKHNSTLNQFIKNQRNRFISVYVFGIIIAILATIIIGLIIVTLFREQTLKITEKMLKHPFTSLGWGLAYLILTPIIVLLLLILTVTAPLAIIIILFYGLIIYLAKLFVAILLGWHIFKYYKKSSGENSVDGNSDKTILVKSMIIGVVVYVLIINIPIAGWLISLLGTIWAMGAVGRVVSEWVEGKIGKRE